MDRVEAEVETVRVAPPFVLQNRRRFAPVPLHVLMNPSIQRASHPIPASRGNSRGNPGIPRAHVGFRRGTQVVDRNPGQIDERIYSPDDIMRGWNQTQPRHH